MHLTNETAAYNMRHWKLFTRESDLHVPVVLMC
jgi:hypothetical protein